MKKKTGNIPKTSEKIAGSIAQLILRAQEKWVGFMKRRTVHLSIAAQKKWLIAFVALFGSFCIYLILGGVTRSNKMPISSPSAIVVPKLQEENIQVGEGSDSLIVRTVREYYHKRDSLMRFAPEQWQWVVDNRPGLIDSMEQLEVYIQRNGLYKQ